MGLHIFEASFDCCAQRLEHHPEQFLQDAMLEETVAAEESSMAYSDARARAHDVELIAR
jgi:hypothetical protein